jgi:hypothetical protein
MYLRTLALLCALASTCAADSMAVYSRCTFDQVWSCSSDKAIFYTDFGAYNIDANGGCRGTGVPSMVDFCVDWSQSRAHFRYSHQSFKRCLVQTGTLVPNFCTDGARCSLIVFEEGGCTWRQAPNLNDTEPEVTESATTVPIPATTLATVLVPDPGLTDENEPGNRIQSIAAPDDGIWISPPQESLGP